MAKAVKECSRCGATRNIEVDHILAKKDWPMLSITIDSKHTLNSIKDIEALLETPKNKRYLCRACHDYRHARELALAELRKALLRGEPVKVSMWIFRLGLIEWGNTPEKVKEQGYTPYWNYPETHYAPWYPKMKSLVNEHVAKEQVKLG